MKLQAVKKEESTIGPIIQLIHNDVDNEVTTAQIWTVIQKFHHPHLNPAEDKLLQSILK